MGGKIGQIPQLWMSELPDNPPNAQSASKPLTIVGQGVRPAKGPNTVFFIFKWQLTVKFLLEDVLEYFMGFYAFVLTQNMKWAYTFEKTSSYIRGKCREMGTLD
jgi:hypothetical protein